jgi:hypothetical protein
MEGQRRAGEVDRGTEEGRRGGWKQRSLEESRGVGAGNLWDVWGGAGRSGGFRRPAQQPNEVRTDKAQPLNIASMTEQKGHGD